MPSEKKPLTPKTRWLYKERERDPEREDVEKGRGGQQRIQGHDESGLERARVPQGSSDRAR